MAGKPKKRPSAYAGVTWLKVRGKTQQSSGLTFHDRTLLRGQQLERPVLWFLGAWVQTLLLTGGTVVTAVTGFGVQVETLSLTLGLLLLTALFTGFCLWKKLDGKRRYVLFVGGLLYFGLLFVTQDVFQQGGYAVWNAVLHRINSKYHMALSLIHAADPQSVTWFLLELLIPVGLVLAALTIYRPDSLILALLLIPGLSFLLLLGGTPWEGGLLLLLLGLLASWTAGRSVWKKRLWGDPASEDYRRNTAAYYRIQRKATAVVCVASLVLTLPVALLQPALTIRLRPAEQLTMAVEGQLLSLLTQWMPVLSNGQLSLQTETTGSGVTDGALGETEGFVVTGVEDLRVICGDKPEETVYLKGFIGTVYQSDRWAAGEDSELRSMAAGWATEGDPALYVQNLPFLRGLYTEAKQPHLMIVQRLNASERYTYHPYNCFLSDYYHVTAGDGAVSGLGTTEDRFSYFSRQETAALLEEWERTKEAPSVLDRAAEGYEGYVDRKDLTIPEGFEELQAQCLAEELDREKVEEVRRYIRLFLAEHYEYDLKAELPGEDEDFLQKFLYETKRGYSAHFATAAVVMFRMFGIPARYVTGYAVPQNLFTLQPDGSWAAVAQDDNAHAWAEVYLSGIGWTPMEMTPGMVGTQQDLSYDPDMTDQTSSTEAEQPEEDTPSTAEPQPGPLAPLKAHWKELLAGAAAVILAAAAAVLGAVCCHRYRRAYGLDQKRSLSLRGQDIFRTYHRTLVKKGMAAETDSTSAEFAACAQTVDGALTDADAAWLVAFALGCCYSPREPEEQEVDRARMLLKRLKKGKGKLDRK